MIEYKKIIDDDGNKFFYMNGKFHNENGPAIIYANGIKNWYLDGICYTENEFNAKNVCLKSKIKLDII